MSTLQQQARAMLARAGRVGAPRIQAAGAPRIQAAGMPRAQLAQAGQFPREDIQYEPENYSGGGLTVCGIPVTLIPSGGGIITVEVRAVRPILPQQIRFPSTVVGLLIHGFKIQGLDLDATRPGAGTPIECLSEVSRLRGMQWPSIDQSTPLEIQVSNPAPNYTGVDAARYLAGTIYGTNLTP